MAFRIGEYVVRGELSNVQRNSVTGWIEWSVNPGEDPCGVKIELTGNLKGPFEGRHIRFSAEHSGQQPNEAASELLDALALIQIGVVGDMLLRTVRVPPGSVKEFYLHGTEFCSEKGGEPLPCEEKPCLYLEWFSQNGRVVAEIVDARVEFVDESSETDDVAVPEPLPDVNSAGDDPGITAFSMDEDSNMEESPFSPADDQECEDEDPYEIFPSDLEERIDGALQGPNGELPPYDRDAPPGRRNWDEVIPGIDEKTKRMYEQWDEVANGDKDEPLSTLFDPPLKLMLPDQVTREEEAESLLDMLLTRLATHSVAIDVCEHFTALETYRWLLEVILPEADIHPQLSEIGFVQHFSTWEDCPRCAEEFEAEEFETGEQGLNPPPET